MPEVDDVLIRFITTANMTGIKETQAGILGMSSAMTAALAGFGLLVVAGKSAMDIAEQREGAEKSLSQALKAQDYSQWALGNRVQDTIDKNRAYISNQSEVVQGYADLIRSGISVEETQKDINRAIDLAALKHISLNDAVQLLIAAEHGRTRGLIDLGITTSKYTDAQGNVINQGKDMAKVMEQIDIATAHGRETTSETTKVTNELSNDWQDIANTAGPPLIGILDLAAQELDNIVQWLKWIGENKGWNDFLYNAFGNIQAQIIGAAQAIQAVVGAVQWLIDNAGRVHLGGSSDQSIASGSRRASGGPVWPGWSGTVGEHGIERLDIGPGGFGMVTPLSGSSAGGSGITVHVDARGSFFPDGPSLDRLSNLIAQRLTFASGR